MIESYITVEKDAYGEFYYTSHVRRIWKLLIPLRWKTLEPKNVKSYEKARELINAYEANFY